MEAQTPSLYIYLWERIVLHVGSPAAHTLPRQIDTTLKPPNINMHSMSILHTERTNEASHKNTNSPYWFRCTKHLFWYQNGWSIVYRNTAQLHIMYTSVRVYDELSWALKAPNRNQYQFRWGKFVISKTKRNLYSAGVLCFFCIVKVLGAEILF